MRMQGKHKAILRKHQSKLLKEVEMNELFLAALLSNDVIDDIHKERIESKPTNTAKMGELLNILPRLPATAFEGFCKALEDTDQGDIVDSYLKDTTQFNEEDIYGAPDPGEREMKFKEVLANNRVDLMDKLDVESRLFAQLMKHEVLPRHMQKQITHNADPDLQVERLLDYLVKRPITDLDHFLDALRDSNQEHVAEFLEEQML